MRSRFFSCVQSVDACAYEFMYAKIATVAGGLIFSFSVFVSFSCNCFSCAVCALKLLYAVTNFTQSNIFIKVWFYANVNTVNGQCVCAYVIRHTFRWHWPKWMNARFLHFYIRTFITPFNNIECDIFCVFVHRKFTLSSPVFLCCFLVSLRLPIHSYAIAADSFFSALL